MCGEGKKYDLVDASVPAVCLQFALLCVCARAQSRPVLCGPMDRSPPGSSVHGILQARVLEWVAIPFSRGLPCFIQ